MKSSVVEEIRAFCQLERNWDGYGAIPLPIQVFDNAVLLINGLDILPTDFYPNPRGTLGIDYESLDGFLYIEVGPTSITYYTREITRDKIIINDNSIRELNIHIHEI